MAKRKRTKNKRGDRGTRHTHVRNMSQDSRPGSQITNKQYWDTIESRYAPGPRGNSSTISE